MGSLKNTLAVIGCLAFLGFGVYQFYLFNNTGEGAGSRHLWFAIGGAALAFVCGLIYFLGRVNKEEEIHITQ